MPDETHQEASARRAAELGALLREHLGYVAEAHKMHPTPPNLRFHEMSEDDQRRWNQKREVIDSANRAYNRKVRETCERHRAEQDEVIAAHLEAAAKMPDAPRPAGPAAPAAPQPKIGGR